jgi:hypothetical protein
MVAALRLAFSKRAHFLLAHLASEALKALALAVDERRPVLAVCRGQVTMFAQDTAVVVLAKVALAVSLTEHTLIFAVGLLKSAQLAVVALVLEHSRLATERDLHRLAFGAVTVGSIECFRSGIFAAFCKRRSVTLTNIAFNPTPFERAVAPALARLRVDDTILATLGVIAHAVVASDATPIGGTEGVCLGALGELGVGVLALFADRLAHGGLSVVAGLGVAPFVVVAACLPD